MNRVGVSHSEARKQMPTPGRAEPMGMNDFDAGLSDERSQGAPSAPAAASNCASGLNSAPADFMEFVRAGTVSSAASALRLSRGTVHQLRAGYWPDDARRLLKAWSEYKGRTGRIQSSWFLRRVRTGGVVRHAGAEWTGVGLAQRVGELVAVARTSSGELLAQTLEMPAQRLPLEPRS